MGSRNHYDTVTAVIRAFIDQNTWRQAELASHVRVQSPRVKVVLENLREWGMPLAREEEVPHVYWSVPKGWFPGGVFFRVEDLPTLIDAVVRMSKTHVRERLLRQIFMGRGTFVQSAREAAEALHDSVVVRTTSEAEARWLPMIEDALARRCAMTVDYFSSSSGRRGQRIITPHRLHFETRARLLATCHRAKELRWFRVDNFISARVEVEQEAAVVDSSLLQAYVERTVDGFHADASSELSFRVQEPDARWIVSNLLPGMRVDHEGSTREYKRVVCGGGAPVVARFIAGLGGAAIAESENLRLLVKEIAEAVLRSNGGTGT